MKRMGGRVRPGWVVGLALFLGVSLTDFAAAHRHFLNSYPNSDRVPCPGDWACCLGTGICEAFGHDGCCASGDDEELEGDGGDRRLSVAVVEHGPVVTPEWAVKGAPMYLGDVVGAKPARARGRRLDDDEASWGGSVVVADSDGDGLSNGDELGDPCGEWDPNGNVSPRETYDISHPLASSSTTGRASCTFTAPTVPAAGGTVKAVELSDGDIIVWGLLDDRSSSCWCYRTVTPAGSTALSQWYRKLLDSTSSSRHPSAPATSASSSSAALDAVRLCSSSGAASVTVGTTNLHSTASSAVTVEAESSASSADVTRATALQAMLPCATSHGSWSRLGSVSGPVPPSADTILAPTFSVTIIVLSCVALVGACLVSPTAAHANGSVQWLQGRLCAAGCVRATFCPWRARAIPRSWEPKVATSASGAGEGATPSVALSVPVSPDASIASVPRHRPATGSIDNPAATAAAAASSHSTPAPTTPHEPQLGPYSLTTCTCRRFSDGVQDTVRSVGSGSASGLLLSLALVGSCLGAGFGTLATFDNLIYPYGNGAPIARAIGVAALPALLFSSFLSTKIVGAPLLGLSSPERAVVLHRWVGALSLTTVLVHGIWMTVATSARIGLWQIFHFQRSEGINVAAGTIVGFLVIAMGAGVLLRRVWYSLFWALHALTSPLILLFTFLHLEHSDTITGAAYMGGAAFVIGVDAIVAYLLPPLLFDTSVKEIRVLVPPTTSSAAGGVARLILERRPTMGFLSYALSAPIKAGKYLHVLAPGLSLLGHPFTIVAESVDAPHTSDAGAGAGAAHASSTLVPWSESTTDPVGRPQRIEMLIRGGPRGSWSANLVRAASMPSRGVTVTDEGPLLRTVFSFGQWGRPHALAPEAYDHVVAIAGGIGITPAAALIAARGSRQAADKTATLIWAAREINLAAYVLSHLAHTYGDRAGASPDGAFPAADGDPEEHKEASAEMAAAALTHLNARPSLHATVAITGAERKFAREPLTTSRPDLPSLLVAAGRRAAAASKSTSPPRVFVLVVGPSALEAAAYDAVAALNASPACPADFHISNEAFKW